MTTLPGCAIRGHHSRDAHKAYCRPAIDAAWQARPRPPRRLTVSEPRRRPPMAHPATEPVPIGYDRLGTFLLALVAILAGLAAAAQLGAFGPVAS